MAYRRTYFDGQVTTPAIVPSAVTEEKIADDAITSRKIKDETITGADIGVGQVQTEDLADGAVTARKLGSDVSIVPLADNAVSTAKIQDNAVVTQKIDNQAVTGDKLQDASVSSIKIGNGAVTNTKIGTSAVTKIKLASNSVGYLEIINGSIEPRHIRAVDTPVNGEVPSYNQAQERFEWKPAAGGGVTKHTDLTDKEVAGVIDHANDSIPVSKLQSENVPQNLYRASYSPATGKISWLPHKHTTLEDKEDGDGVIDHANQSVTTAKIKDGAVTRPKLSYKVISITIPALQVGGIFPPLGDPDLDGGVILGYSIPVNQDQILRQLFLLPGLPQGTGVSILLNAPAIADNTFEVVVLRQ